MNLATADVDVDDVKRLIKQRDLNSLRSGAWDASWLDAPPQQTVFDNSFADIKGASVRDNVAKEKNWFHDLMKLCCRSRTCPWYGFCHKKSGVQLFDVPTEPEALRQAGGDNALTDDVLRATADDTAADLPSDDKISVLNNPLGFLRQCCRSRSCSERFRLGLWCRIFKSENSIDAPTTDALQRFVAQDDTPRDLQSDDKFPGVNFIPGFFRLCCILNFCPPQVKKLFCHRVKSENSFDAPTTDVLQRSVAQDDTPRDLQSGDKFPDFMSMLRLCCKFGICTSTPFGILSKLCHLVKSENALDGPTSDVFERAAAEKAPWGGWKPNGNWGHFAPWRPVSPGRPVVPWRPGGHWPGHIPWWWWRANASTAADVNDDAVLGNPFGDDIRRDDDLRSTASDDKALETKCHNLCHSLNCHHHFTPASFGARPVCHCIPTMFTNPSKFFFHLNMFLFLSHSFIVSSFLLDFSLTGF